MQIYVYVYTHTHIKAENKKRSIDYLQDVDDLVMESFGKRKK